jgi:hypothetical protein
LSASAAANSPLLPSGNGRQAADKPRNKQKVMKLTIDRCGLAIHAKHTSSGEARAADTLYAQECGLKPAQHTQRACTVNMLCSTTAQNPNGYSGEERCKEQT